MRRSLIMGLLLLTACEVAPFVPFVAEPSCVDGEVNGDETGLDCGGSCELACGVGAGCLLASDCVEGVCQAGRCQEASCEDGVHNGEESDLDCGGPCEASCGIDQGCLLPGDCGSGVCEEGLCAAPRCDDGVHNGEEADLDCGFTCGQPCATDQLCLLAEDCESLVCDGGRCAAPRCDDSVHNGDEMAQDCGGSCAAGCPADTRCLQASDCLSQICQEGFCAPDPVENCLAGPHAANDPRRQEACRMLGYMNADRNLFVDEAGNALPLQWDPDLFLVAAAHSRDMCERAYFAHQNPDGESPSDRARRMGFNVPVAENIAVNLDAASAQHAFMHEPTCTGHRGNILNPRNVTVGIGIVECDHPGFQWDDYVMYTQNFRMDFGVAESAYCQNPALDCELPPDPVSTATAECPAQVVRWGWCDYDPAEIMEPRWNCPDD